MKPMVTTIRNSPESPADSATLALAALGWVLQDADRAERFLGLTGLDADTLRAGLGERRVQASVLEFLANHEPDLLRCAEALAVTPEELAAAGKELAA
jgi:hypothetical protein